MQPEPTTWRSTPVCATEAMIEAGMRELRAPSLFPFMADRVARDIVRRVVNAAMEASPKPPVKSSRPTAARDMTGADLKAELKALHARWDAFVADTGEKGGGSPGEWMVERMEEIETELKRRGAQPLLEPPATGDADHG